MTAAAQRLENPASANVAQLLAPLAAERPDAPAIILARTGESLSFGELDAWSDRLAHGLASRGVKPGTRALVLVRPGTDFAAFSFALMKVGAVPVFVDPGLGRKNLLACIEEAAPEVLFAIRPLLVLKWFLRRTFRSVRLVFSDRPFPQAISLDALALDGRGPYPVHPASADDPAVVAFTSGSTGTPKGVVLTHGVARAQVRVLRERFGVDSSSRQLAVLPMLALLGPGLGCASVLPDLDASKPAKADPARVVRGMQEHHVTHAFGSPAIWSKVAAWCLANGVTLPDMRALLVGGAPVAPQLLRDFQAILTHGATHSPLGATEAITITSASGADIVRAADESPAGLGTLVGTPVPGAEVRVIRIVDGPIDRDDASLDVPTGEPGEIIVRGPLVTPAYDQHPEANRLSKIPSAKGPWHRMGDLGRLDAQLRLWFCGRKSERVETASGLLLTACVEPLLQGDSRVRRLALIGLGERPSQRAFVVVEPVSQRDLWWPPARRRLVRDVLDRAALNPATRAIEGVLVKRRLPLDVRHAAKILRGELAAWASGKVR